MAEVRFLPPAAKFIKKIKDSKLKKLYKEAIDEICSNPMIGEEKLGDLTGIRGYDIYYNRTNYELAYTVEYIQNEDNGETEIVVVVMAGTRENFYDQLKRYWNR
ncbi:MAG: type II toxin-antitoxin system RelE/ParE family toxin [Lachnospiraceae bacterium]|nr:type II toxin-antitoxin system RelE/ParE family toxin [Lachnospiraceae bacterium]